MKTQLAQLTLSENTLKTHTTQKMTAKYTDYINGNDSPVVLVDQDDKICLELPRDDSIRLQISTFDAPDTDVVFGDHTFKCSNGLPHYGEIAGLDEARERVGEDPQKEIETDLYTNSFVAPILVGKKHKARDAWLGRIFVPNTTPKYVVKNTAGQIIGTRKLILVKDKTIITPGLAEQLQKEYERVLLDRYHEEEKAREQAKEQEQEEKKEEC